MGKIKQIWAKLNPRAAVVGGLLIVTTSIGTCQFARVELVGTIEGSTPPISEPVAETENVDGNELETVEAIEAE